MEQATKSYRKKVITCYNNVQVTTSYRNKQQAFYRFVAWVTGEVTASYRNKLKKYHQLQQVTSILHEACNVIKKEGHLGRYFSKDLLKIWVMHKKSNLSDNFQKTPLNGCIWKQEHVSWKFPLKCFQWSWQLPYTSTYEKFLLKNALWKLYCSAKPSLALQALFIRDCSSQAITFVKCNKYKEMVTCKEDPIFFSMHNEMLHDSWFLISN